MAFSGTQEQPLHRDQTRITAHSRRFGTEELKAGGRMIFLASLANFKATGRACDNGYPATVSTDVLSDSRSTYRGGFFADCGISEVWVPAPRSPPAPFTPLKPPVEVPETLTQAPCSPGALGTPPIPLACSPQGSPQQLPPAPFRAHRPISGQGLSPGASPLPPKTRGGSVGGTHRCRSCRKHPAGGWGRKCKPPPRRPAGSSCREPGRGSRATPS